MPICVAVPRETVAGEARVALNPEVVARLIKQGFEVLVEKGAGESACYPDANYVEAEATLVGTSAALYGRGDGVVKVQAASEAEIELMRESSIVISLMQPHKQLQQVAQFA